ncbi:MAG: hypothetical protein JO092_09795 [Candidatus Eremiobacteraeota bacterium]|nr:hypothetical protein [Candidatus Eremiobacteraeota bacterium]
MASSRISIPVVLLVSLSLSSCNSSRPLPLAAPAFAPAAERTGLRPSIGGIVNTKDFVVPAGAFVTVDKNLTVFATGSVSIEGTLSVAPGISVAFFTPGFTIKGAPAGLEGGAINGNSENKHYLGPVNDIVSACQIDIQNTAQWIVGGGDNLAFTSDSKSQGGHKCAVYVGSTRGVQGTQSLVLDDGAVGGTYPHRYIGGNGGWIEIGSPQAIAVTEKLAKKAGHPALLAYPPDTVTLASALVAGNGGKGRTDDLGSLTGGVWQFAAYDGGIGGSIEIAGGTIAGGRPRIAAGNGGNGGDLAVGFLTMRSSSAAYPLSGTAMDPNAIPAALTMGSGGGGGGIFITSKAPSNVLERAGNGGNPSTVGTFAGGDGCCPTTPNNPPKGHGNGGSVTVYLSGPGLHGPNGNNRPNRPRNGRYSLISIYLGGAGSAWINPNYYINKGAVSEPGGNGGSLTFVPPPHVPIGSLGDYRLRIQVLNCCSGSNASSFCAPMPPSPPGVPGGNAGNLHDNGLFQYITPQAGIWGFNGGSGGNGTPPGKGGAAGVNDEGQQLGMPGNTGGVC